MPILLTSNFSIDSVFTSSPKMPKKFQPPKLAYLEELKNLSEHTRGSYKKCAGCETEIFPGSRAE